MNVLRTNNLKSEDFLIENLKIFYLIENLRISLEDGEYFFKERQKNLDSLIEEFFS